MYYEQNQPIIYKTHDTFQPMTREDEKMNNSCNQGLQRAPLAPPGYVDNRSSSQLNNFIVLPF